MRDMIVAGAGGGGAVIAKELAARGLDVVHTLFSLKEVMSMSLS